MSNKFIMPEKPTLKECLLVLNEPVLIVGNKAPDGDSLGSAVAILEFLRNEGVEAYIHCVLPPDPTISWLLEPEDMCETILEDYESLIVVDDVVDSDRLGIPIKDVLTINIDHHISNMSSDLLESIIQNKENTFISDGLILRVLNVKPATACLLMDEEIYHRSLYISLYTDTLGFRVNTKDVIPYVSKLIEVEELEADYVDNINKRMNPLVGSSGLINMLNSSLYTISGSINDESISIAVAVADLDDSSVFEYRSVLESFSRFTDVVVLINGSNGKVSLRSSNQNFTVSDIANHFGGGGHLFAAGCSFSSDLLNDTDRMIEALSSKLHNPRIKWCM